MSQSLAQPLAPGVVVASDYRVERELARGGMGTIYLVTQLSTAAERVLKVMHARLLRDPKSRERFLQEARAGARIESDHVVQVLAAGIEDDGVPWIVMELLRGETLGEAVKRRGPLPAAEVAEVFSQLGHALAAAHRAGLVHRDLKPDNVFLCAPRREGVPFTVKLLDFGIAKALDDDPQPGARHATAAVGTPLWMAPEQAQRGTVTPASDVWSLGLVAYTALTARSYWRSGNVPGVPMERVLRELFGEPLEPASVRAHEHGVALPSGFDAWFAGCVVPDPAARFRDGAEALARLLPVLHGAAPGPAAPAPAPPTVPPTQMIPAMPFAPVAPPSTMARTAPTPYNPGYSAPGPFTAAPFAPVAPPPAPHGGTSVLGAAAVGLLLGAGILGGGWFAVREWRAETRDDAGAATSTPRDAAVLRALLPPVPLTPGVSTLSAGYGHTCALAAGGTVRCWGWNAFGQLGDGSFAPHPTATVVAGLDHVLEVVAGYAHACARRDDGTVRCWGLNSTGQLGDGTRMNRGTPVLVAGLAGVTQLALGEGHSCARLGDGTVRCWGDNTTGQLGDGSADSRTVPGAVVGIAGAVEVAAGNLHTCARLADTTVRCWGASSFGQVGDGYAETHWRPSPVAGVNHAAGLALGAFRSCVRLDGGDVRCWGRNESGQLGDGTRFSRTTPVPVVGLAGAQSLALGAFHACARMSDATLRCWGSNAFGQLADGTTLDRPAPVPASAAGVVQVAAGDAHTCARSSDGAARCWGGNAFGQVGAGDEVNHGVPVPVLGL